MRRRALVAPRGARHRLARRDVRPGIRGQPLQAFAWPERTNPNPSVEVDDFRINETVWDSGGAQYVWVRGPAIPDPDAAE